MATLIEVETGRVGYHDVVRHVLRHSRERSPRGLATRDAGWVTVVVRDPSDSLPLGCGRGVKPAVAAVEALQLLGGVSNPALTVRVAGRFADFREPDGRFHGAYGTRVGAQVGCAVHKLRGDPATRQAVVTLWDPWLDNLPDRRDYPCTVALGLALGADDRLDLNVTMRSNDVWLGFPYDVFQFTQLQLTVARALGREVGVYRHTAWSLHVYETDVERAEAVTYPTSTSFYPRGLGVLGDPWASFGRRAQRLLDGASLGVDETQSERWYREALAPYVG